MAYRSKAADTMDKLRKKYGGYSGSETQESTKGTTEQPQSSIYRSKAADTMDKLREKYRDTGTSKKQETFQPEQSFHPEQNSKDTLDQLKQRQNELKSQLSERENSGDMGGTTLMRREYDRTTNQLNALQKNYKDNFFGQFGANYTQGRLSQDSASAWNDYLTMPTEENRKKAETIDAILEQFQTRNYETLKDDANLPLLSQSLAGYLPQLVDQTKATMSGGLVGAGVGSAVPVVGTLTGAKAGATAASGMYSYNTMRGSAFRDLLKLGFDEETARAAASDEAVVSAMIEMGDTLMDMSGLSFGAGSIIDIARKGLTKKFTKEGAEAVAESAAKKLLKGLGRYGLTVGSEMLEEGAQQAVSIANRERLSEGGDSGVAALTGRSARVAWDALMGADPEARAEILEAGIEGGKIAAMMGGATAVGTGVMNHAINRNQSTNPVEKDVGKVEQPVTPEPSQQPVIAPVQRDAEMDAVLSQIVAEWGRDGVREPALISEEMRKVQPDSSTRIREAEARAVRSAYEAGLAGQSVSSIPKGASSAELDAYAAGREERVRRAGQEAPSAKTAQTAQEPLSEQMNMDTAKPVERAGANTEALVRSNTEQTFAKYGDKGTEAFNRIVEETGEDPEKVRMEFQSAYESGLSNRPQEQTALHSDVQQTAYDAGLRDRAASLKQEQTAAAARTFGKGGGLVQNDYSVKLDTKTADTLDKIGKATGAKIVMDNTLIGSQSNGYYENGEIHISPDAWNPVLQVAKHELTHYMQDAAPTEYRAFRDYAVQVLSAGTWDIYGSNTTAEGMRERYLSASNGAVDLTTETAMDEIAAHYAERILTDEDALNDFVNHVTRSEDHQTRSMGQKFFEAVQNFIDKVKRLFKGNQQKMDAAAQGEFGTTIAQLEHAEQLWKEAYRAVEQSANQSVHTMENRDTIDRKYSVKEGAYDGEGSRENRKAFTERNEGRGWQTQTYGETAVVFIPVSREDAGGIAEGIQRELSSLGIESFFHGGIQSNIDGVTRNMNGEAHTIPGHIVGINARTTQNKKEVAGHEAFHYWLEDRAEFEQILIDNIQDYAPETLMFMAETVMLYSQDGHIDNALLHEEFRARIAGMLHANKRTAVLRKMLRDYDTVKAAWDKLVAQQSGVQFSLKGQSSLLKENAKLREVNAHLQEQFKTTKFAKTDQKSLEKLTRQLLKEYSSRADLTETQAALDSLYTYLANGEDQMPPSWNEAYKQAYEAAVSILENASMTDDQLYQDYKALRDRLRTVGVTLDEQYSSDLQGYEGFSDFRKRNFGRLKLVKDGTPVDVLYQELTEEYPEFFDAELTHPADQLVHIAEVLTELQPVTGNPYSHNMRESATWLANDIMERFFELPQAKPTFADKAAQKLDQRKARDAQKLEKVRREKNERIAQILAENREKVKTVQEEARARQKAAEKKLREKHKEQLIKGRERRKAKSLRERIIQHTNQLSQKLLHPNDKQHIPEELRSAVAVLLESINLESGYEMAVDEDGNRHRVKPGTTPDAERTKRTKAFIALKELYSKLNEGGELVIDPSLLGGEGFEKGFDAVIALADTPIANMNSKQLQTLWEVLRAVEHSISTAGKTLSAAKFQRTQDWANALVSDTASRRKRKGSVLEKFQLDLENPYTFFSHYGEAGKAVFRMLRDAQDHQQEMVEQIRQETEQIADSKTIRKWEHEVHTFQTERGSELHLTTAHCMELYELRKREHAQEHLMKGGIVQPEISHKRIRRGTDAVLLSEADLKNIVSVLNDKQIKVADALQKLTCTTLADFGNEASMKAYGYKKFTERNYWPIKSAKEARHSNVEKGGNNTRSIKNIGLAKSVIPHADNSLDINGIFQTFAAHAGDMTDYAAWLCPMEDANRLFNYQFRDEAGLTRQNIKGLLDRVGGAGSQTYWERLMEDIQNGIKMTNDTALMGPLGKAIGNVKGASVGWNIRVVVQQPTAILRAAVVLNPVDMAAGLASGGGWKTALQYSSIAKRKAMGGFDLSSPVQMREILFDQKNALQRFNEVGALGAAKADELTWGRIWNACEHAVQRKHGDLKTGTPAFYEETAKLFDEVIDQTQVVDGVLQRSQAMRSSNALLNQATAFMGEPTMAMNLLLRSWDAFRGETDTQKRSLALRTFGRAGVVLVATNAFNAFAQSLVDAIRDDDEEEKYPERIWKAFSGLTGEEETQSEKVKNVLLEGNLAGNLNPVGQVPFLKDILSITSGYSVYRADAAILEDVIQAGTAFIDSINGTGKKTVPNALKNLTQQVGKVLGISMPNLLRDVYGIMRSFAVETGDIAAQYELEKWIYTVQNTDNKSRFMQLAYRAYTQNDMKLYVRIVQELIDNGVEATYIESRMNSLAKKDNYKAGYLDRDSLFAGIELRRETPKEDKFTIDDLNSRQYERYMDERGDTLVDIIHAFRENGFRQLDSKTADTYLNAAYSYAEQTALNEVSNGDYEFETKWIATLSELERQGFIGPEDAVLFHLAYELTKGKDKKDQVREWLEDNQDLSELQRELLWGTAYPNSRW